MSPSWKGAERLEGVQAGATDMIKAVETRLWGARLKGLELCRLEEAGESQKKPTPEMSHRDPP